MINICGEFLFEYDFKENESYTLEADFDFNEELNLPLDIEVDLRTQNNLIVNMSDIQICQECTRD